MYLGGMYLCFLFLMHTSSSFRVDYPDKLEAAFFAHGAESGVMIDIFASFWGFIHAVHVLRRICPTDRLSYFGQLLSSATVGKKAIVADAHKAVW